MSNKIEISLPTAGINIVGALVTIGFGLLGLMLPAKVGRMVGLEAKTKSGHSEFRATYGGVWLTIGLAALWFREPTMFAIVGLAWIGDSMTQITRV